MPRLAAAPAECKLWWYEDIPANIITDSVNYFEQQKKNFLFFLKFICETLSQLPFSDTQ